MNLRQQRFVTEYVKDPNANAGCDQGGRNSDHASPSRFGSLTLLNPKLRISCDAVVRKGTARTGVPR